RHSHQQTDKATLTLNFHINPSTHLPVLDIIDDGAGVEEKNKDQVFEPFYTTESTGTGLGLYISRELCEANQSRLDYVRDDNNKSCFRISFPHPDRRLAPD
ncbi:MAG: ATP-binding protein, partial [Spongiibacteraceae bacterium]|nr:ATP-binding protein [Spongiibacteraceae bacterium]